MLLGVLIRAELSSSKREARQFIVDGAVTLDGRKVTDVDHVVSDSPFQLLRRGKKQLCVLQVTK